MFGTTNTSKNMWRRNGRLNFPLNGLVFYAPLWHPQLHADTFNAWDVVNGAAHACTKTGVVWGTTGGNFDGNDDKIACGTSSATAIYGKTGFTIISWVYIDSDGGGDNGRICERASGYIFQVSSQSTGKVAITGYIYHDGGTNADGTSTVTVTISAWHMLAAIYNRNADKKVELFSDLSALTLSVNNAGVGSPANDTASTLYLGNRGAADRGFDGIKGDDFMFNRPLTLAELANVNRATKWRYQ